MKSLLALALSLAFSLSASAATLQLEGGDVVTLSPNTTTTVSCGLGSGSINNCHDKADLLSKLLNACGSPGSTWCLQNTWPKWKANNTQCIDEGSLACLSFCGQGSAWCVQTCQ